MLLFLRIQTFFLGFVKNLSIYKKNISRKLSGFAEGKRKRCFVQGKLCFLSKLESFIFFRLSKQQSLKKGEKEKGEKCI